MREKSTSHFDFCTANWHITIDTKTGNDLVSQDYGLVLRFRGSHHQELRVVVGAAGVAHLAGVCLRRAASRHSIPQTTKHLNNNYQQHRSVTIIVSEPLLCEQLASSDIPSRSEGRNQTG
eukprot:scaffold205984_cov37-Prasinocladus_malaysianus.AAC.1